MQQQFATNRLAKGRTAALLPECAGKFNPTEVSAGSVARVRSKFLSPFGPGFTDCLVNRRSLIPSRGQD